MHMLAGPAYNEKLGNPAGRLQRMLKAGKTNREIIGEIYLAAFARYPEKAEIAGLQNLIAAAGQSRTGGTDDKTADGARHSASAGEDREAALKEFMWAVLCSREFAENH
jgi:hypothetical protein